MISKRREATKSRREAAKRGQPVPGHFRFHHCSKSMKVSSCHIARRNSSLDTTCPALSSKQPTPEQAATANEPTRYSYAAPASFDRAQKYRNEIALRSLA